MSVKMVDDYNRRTVGDTYEIDGATRHGTNQLLKHMGEEARNQRPGAGSSSRFEPESQSMIGNSHFNTDDCQVLTNDDDDDDDADADDDTSDIGHYAKAGEIMSPQMDQYNRITIGDTYEVDGVTHHGNNQSLEHFGEIERNQKPGAGLPSSSPVRDHRCNVTTTTSSTDDNNSPLNYKNNNNNDIDNDHDDVDYSNDYSDIRDSGTLSASNSKCIDELYKTCQNQHFSIGDNNYTGQLPVGVTAEHIGHSPLSVMATSGKKSALYREHASRESLDSTLNPINVE